MKKLFSINNYWFNLRSGLLLCLLSLFFSDTRAQLLWSENFDAAPWTSSQFGPTWATGLGTWFETVTPTGQTGWSTSTTTPRSTTKCMLAGQAGNGSATYLMTPGQVLTAKSTYSFAYWMRTYSSTGTDGFTVKIIVGTVQTTSGMTAGTILATYTSPGTDITGTYKQFSANFTPATSGTYYFCIYALRSAANYVLADDVTFTKVCDAPTGGTVTGPNSICSGATNQTYSISTVSGTSLTYSWSVPSGASLVSTNNTSSTTMTVNWGSTAGSVNCYPISTGLCIGNAVSYPVTFIAAPAQPSPITLPTTICSGASATYSVTAAADHYGWANTAGWTGSSTTNSINLTANSSSTTITVTPFNVCNQPGTPRTAVAAPNLPIPNTPGPIVSY